MEADLLKLPIADIVLGNIQSESDEAHTEQEDIDKMIEELNLDSENLSA
jgi:hypothetical protein